jgi:paraquat-inducible protein B
MSEHTEASSVSVKTSKGISAVWLVPIIALVFGAWIAYKAISEKGPLITIKFDSANGIVVNKTQVKYKGLNAGVVKSITLDDDMEQVSVLIEMKPETKQLINDETSFWFVTANVSLAGVSGLDTLLSGSYIAIKPGKGNNRKSEFIALKQAPPKDESTPGLHLKLTTPELGSIKVNSPVSYKQLKVGYVTSFEYDNDQGEVDIQIFIEPAYANLVRENTRFWNASGIELSANLSTGVKVRSESLESLIAGGIAFDTLPYQQKRPQAQNNHEFKLFSGYQDATMAQEVHLTFDWDSGIDKGSAIIFQGLQLGEVKEISDINQEQRTISTTAMLDPRVEPYLTDKTQFYIVSPQVSLSGVNNLAGVLLGSYISILPDDSGKPQKQFKVLTSQPPYDYDEPGLHLKLKTEQRGSLTEQSAIYYQGQKVGSIQQIEHLAARELTIHIHIEPQFSQLVNANSRFWQSSGLKIDASLQGINLEADAVSSILAGGIAFETFDKDLQNSKAPVNGSEFSLFNSKKEANQLVNVELNLSSLKGISAGKTRVLYHGREVGSIHNIHTTITDRGTEQISAQLGLLPEYNYVLKDNSQFWLVQPNISLSGLTDTDALFGGAYITFRPGKGNFQKRFTLNDKAPLKHYEARGLQLTLIGESASSLNAGSPVSYKSIPIGQVDNIQLASEQEVEVNISIEPEYQHLIDGYSRFYNVSGLSVSGSLSDLEISTESIDTILKGGLSFYNPEHPEDAVAAKDGDHYQLYHNHIEAKSAGLAIEIYFDDASGLTENTKIKYQQQVIGRVTRLEFEPDLHSVKAYALLHDNASHFAASNSKFWLTTAQIGLVGARHMETMLQGNYITLVPGDGEQQTQFKGLLTEPVTKSKPYGLNITLTANKLGSIRIGNPVLYRQVKVGEVIGVDLADSADQVQIYLNIHQEYAPLVQENSKFWNYSGIHIEAGLFSGVNIDTDSMESIMAGGIAFATPEQAASKAANHSRFKLHGQHQSHWLDWQPKIQLNN